MCCGCSSQARHHIAPSGGSAPDRQAYFGRKGEAIGVPVISRGELTEPMEGPLLIDEYDSTTVVPPGTKVEVDEQGNIDMRIST